MKTETLKVLFEDNHIIVVEKEVNILSQGDITNDIDMTKIVKAYLKEKYQKPGNVYLGLVHRLDRRVGGIMVFAKTSKAASRLSESFATHDVTKRYLAIVKGSLESGKIEVPILKDEKNNIAIISNKGKLGSLTYQVLKEKDNTSLVSINLLTGRYNQIRVSFSYVNHPIINDYKYDKSIIATKDDLALWCYYLSFIHPVSKEEMSFTLLPTRKIWDLYKDTIANIK